MAAPLCQGGELEPEKVKSRVRKNIFFGAVPEPLHQNNPKVFPMLGLSCYSRDSLIVKLTSKVLTDIEIADEKNETQVH